MYYMADFHTKKCEFKVVLYNRIYHSCLCIIEFIKTHCKKAIKCSASLTFYLFSPTCLINSIIYEHSCKILCITYWLPHGSTMTDTPFQRSAKFKVSLNMKKLNNQCGKSQGVQLFR